MTKKLGYRHDLLKWQFDRLKKEGETFRSLSERHKIPQATLCETINGRTRPFPQTILRVYQAVGLNPTYAFNWELKKSQFHSAVL